MERQIVEGKITRKKDSAKVAQLKSKISASKHDANRGDVTGDTANKSRSKMVTRRIAVVVTTPKHSLTAGRIIISGKDPTGCRTSFEIPLHTP
jgi:hypothetical protein